MSSETPAGDDIPQRVFRPARRSVQIPVSADTSSPDATAVGHGPAELSDEELLELLDTARRNSDAAAQVSTNRAADDGDESPMTAEEIEAEIASAKSIALSAADAATAGGAASPQDDDEPPLPDEEIEAEIASAKEISRMREAGLGQTATIDALHAKISQALTAAGKDASPLRIKDARKSSVEIWFDLTVTVSVSNRYLTDFNASYGNAQEVGERYLEETVEQLDTNARRDLDRQFNLETNRLDRAPYQGFTWPQESWLLRDWGTVFAYCDCPTCHGGGTVTCRRCDGSGTETENYTEYKTYYDSGSGRHESRPISRTRKVSCSRCGGDGKSTCETCNGRCKLPEAHQVTTMARAKRGWRLAKDAGAPAWVEERLKTLSPSDWTRLGGFQHEGITTTPLARQIHLTYSALAPCVEAVLEYQGHTCTVHALGEGALSVDAGNLLGAMLGGLAKRILKAGPKAALALARTDPVMYEIATGDQARQARTAPGSEGAVPRPRGADNTTAGQAISDQYSGTISPELADQLHTHLSNCQKRIYERAWTLRYILLASLISVPLALLLGTSTFARILANWLPWGKYWVAPVAACFFSGIPTTGHSWLYRHWFYWSASTAAEQAVNRIDPNYMFSGEACDAQAWTMVNLIGLACGALAYWFLPPISLLFWF